MSITRTNETSIYLSRICPLGVHTKTNMGWTGLHKLVVKWRSDRGIFNEVLASDVIDNGVLARKFLAIWFMVDGPLVGYLTMGWVMIVRCRSHFFVRSFKHSFDRSQVFEKWRFWFHSRWHSRVLVGSLLQWCFLILYESLLFFDDRLVFGQDEGDYSYFRVYHLDALSFKHYLEQLSS